MERAIEAFLCVLGEDFDKNTKIMEKTAKNANFWQFSSF